MTVPPNITLTSYELNGSNLGPFNTIWEYAQDSDVVVYLNTGDSRVQLAAGSQYTLTDAGPLPNSGEVMLASSLLTGFWPAATSLLISRVTARGQPFALGDTAGFSPQTYEDALDNLGRQIEDVSSDLGLALQRFGGAFVAGGRAIVGLVAEPSDPTSAVTYQQLTQAIAAGGGGGGGGGGGELIANFVVDFHGVGDGVTNNDTAFAAAEASTGSQIFLPDGVYVSTRNQNQFTKRYVGPGKITLPSTNLPGNITWIATSPQNAIGPQPQTTQATFFGGDTSHVQPEWFVIGPGTRVSHDAHYFEPGYIPHPAYFDVYAGTSGTVCHATTALDVGATSATVNSAAGLHVGQVIALSPYSQGGGTIVTITDTITIDSISGNTVTFHPPLTTNYPAAVPGAATPGYAVFQDGPRTWNGYRYTRVTNYGGGGDVYGDIVVMWQNYVPQAGQVHFFETSTAGQYGGSVHFAANASGTYATGWESQYIDNGADVAVIAQVDTFSRTNDTGAMGTFWGGTFFNSAGTVPVDVAHTIMGPWRVGFDTVRANLSTWVTPGDNINAAISTALGHRWVMNSTSSTSARSGSAQYGEFFGNVPGDMYVESGNDGISDFISLTFNRASPNNGHLRVRPTQIQTNVSIAAVGNVITDGYFQILSASPQQLVFGTSGVWLEFDGSNLKFTKNSGASYTNIA